MVTLISLAVVVLASACAPIAAAPSNASSLELAGARFEIADAAVAANCVTLAFAVRGFEPPAGADPQAFFPPAASIDVHVTIASGELAARPLGGGAGGGGDEEDGRIWMEQRAHYSLAESISEGEEVALDVIVVLDGDFGHSEPLRFRVPVVAGPGGGSCE